MSDNGNADIMTNSMSDLVNALASGSGSEISRPETIMHNLRFSAVSTNRPLLSAMYVEHGILQTMIDQPVDDAFRGGIKITSDELSADDLKTLNQYMEANGVLQTVAQATKWARLFGGAGLIINAGQKDKELTIDRINEKTPLAFYAVDRWELSFMPKGNMMNQMEDHIADRPYNYYGIPLHRTSVLRFEGKQAPSMQRAQYMGWGMSEFERIVQNFNAYQKNTAVTYEALDEHKVDIFKLTGFNSAMASKSGVAATTNRINLAAKLKNYKNALVVDKEDDYESKQISFGGLAEILNEIRKGIAADVRMPITKLFGMSAAGFNSGEDDIENYNAMVESEVRTKVRPQLNTVVKICCAKALGYVPENIDFEFKPLRIMSSRDESELKSSELNRITSAMQSGLITSDRAAEMVNAARLLPMQIVEAEVMSREELIQMQQSASAPMATPTPEGDSLL